MKTIKKSSAIIIITSFVLVMSGVFGVIAFIVLNPGFSVSASSEDKNMKEKEIYDIENELITKPIEITTNLKSTDVRYGRHYVLTEISLSTLNEKDFSNLEASQVFLKDIYNKYFSNITYSRLMTMENKRIKEEVKNLLMKELDISIKNIYITKFIIQ